MSSLESLEKQLASQKEMHKDDIHSLEMKALLETRRWNPLQYIKITAQALSITRVESSLVESSLSSDCKQIRKESDR